MYCVYLSLKMKENIVMKRERMNGRRRSITLGKRVKSITRINAG